MVNLCATNIHKEVNFNAKYSKYSLNIVEINKIILILFVNF